MRLLSPALQGALLCALSMLPVASATAADDPGAQISFGNQRFDPLTTSGQAPRAARTSADGKALRLVQMVSAPRQEWLAQLESSGAVVLQYYPHNAYLVWSDHAAANRASTLPFARWQGDFSPDWKYGPELKGRLGPIDNVLVEFYNDGQPEATVAAITALGVQVLQTFPAQPDRRFLDAIVKADAGQLAALADLPQVVALGYSSPRAYFDDEISAQVVAGNYTPSVPVGTYPAFLKQIGLNGAGVTWAVTDSGVDLGHPEFAGRISGIDYPGCPSSAQGTGDDNAAGGHGTHVAGILGGAGALTTVDANGYKYGQGIAPAVQIFSQNPICVGTAPWPPAGGWQVLSRNALAGGAIGTNNSWTSGEGLGVGYIATARTFDFMARDGNFDTPNLNEGFIQVFSAGNSGSAASTITSPKEAKNIISLAASNNTRSAGGNLEAVASFSSRGPALDGRTLPTITAPGDSIASTRRRAGASQCGTAIAGTSNNYSLCSGTSMASPHAAGMAILLAQWWKQNHAGAVPSVAMIKALMINGAVDLTGPAAIPNNTEGWGRIHLQRTLADGQQAVRIDQTELLTDLGGVYERTYGVPSSTDGVRITLSWTDAPGAVNASPALVNNLDLEVVADGTLYRGNVFTNGISATGGTADALNNNENVFLPPGVGSVTVRVRATTLPGDGVPNVGDATDQDFALVCTNCAEEPTYTVALSTAEASLCINDTLQRQITVGQVLGYNTAVQFAATGLPAPATTQFSVNPVTPPGTTELSFNANTVAAGSYTLQVNSNSGSINRQIAIPLFIANSPPVFPPLGLPGSGSTNVPATPTFQWQSVLQAYDYRLQVARDAGFTDIVFETITRNTSATPSQALPTNTQFFWRVTARNGCGESIQNPDMMLRSGFEDGEVVPGQQPVSTFTTAAAPGDCPFGTTATILFSEDMESGAAGWTSSGTGNSWALNMAFPHGGANAYRGVAPTVASDQLLATPSIVLPTGGQGLFLKFWNRQSMEPRSGGCWDGGFLEVSTNGGTSYTQITTGLLTDPYDGPLGSGNPATPAPAWCGDPQPYLDSVVDLTPYAGQTVRLRFRLTSDGSQNRPDGWAIDDVRVVRCAP